MSRRFRSPLDACLNLLGILTSPIVTTSDVYYITRTHRGNGSNDEDVDAYRRDLSIILCW